MALDSSIPAGMTVFLARRDLCITTSAERGNDLNDQQPRLAAALPRSFQLHPQLAGLP